MDEIPGYNGRRAPNVSQYIANLNTIPSTQEMSPQGQDGYNFEADLAIFTNTQFFDFDLGEIVDAAPVPGVPAKAGRDGQQNRQGGLGFLNGEYQFPDFPNFENLLDDGTAVVPSPIQTQTSPVYPASSNLSSPAGASSGSGPVISPRTGDKRKADATKAPSLEEASRLAAEEDKRRRNTAASARFRVKKKQREQTLERTAKEMSEKVAQLETRIGQLETENKWLKNLITEKNENKDDITELWRRFNKDGASVLRRSSASSTTPTSAPPSTTTERKDGGGGVAAAGKTTAATAATTSEVRTVDST